MTGVSWRYDCQVWDGNRCSRKMFVDCGAEYRQVEHKLCYGKTCKEEVDVVSLVWQARQVWKGRCGKAGQGRYSKRAGVAGQGRAGQVQQKGRCGLEGVVTKTSKDDPATYPLTFSPGRGVAGGRVEGRGRGRSGEEGRGEEEARGREVGWTEWGKILGRVMGEGRRSGNGEPVGVERQGRRGDGSNRKGQQGGARLVGFGRAWGRGRGRVRVGRAVLSARG